MTGGGSALSFLRFSATSRISFLNLYTDCGDFGIFACLLFVVFFVAALSCLLRPLWVVGSSGSESAGRAKDAFSLVSLANLFYPAKHGLSSPSVSCVGKKQSKVEEMWSGCFTAFFSLGIPPYGNDPSVFWLGRPSCDMHDVEQYPPVLSFRRYYSIASRSLGSRLSRPC